MTKFVFMLCAYDEYGPDEPIIVERAEDVPAAFASLLSDTDTGPNVADEIAWEKATLEGHMKKPDFGTKAERYSLSQGWGGYQLHVVPVFKP